MAKVRNIKELDGELVTMAKSILGGTTDAKAASAKLAEEFDLAVKEVRPKVDAAVKAELEAQAEAGKKQQQEKAAKDQERDQAEADAKKAQKKADEEVEKAAKAKREADQKRAAAEGKVIVNVPKPFRLKLDGGDTVEIKAGPQSMPASYAKHWYSKAMGVQVVE